MTARGEANMAMVVNAHKVPRKVGLIPSGIARRVTIIIAPGKPMFIAETNFNALT